MEKIKCNVTSKYGDCVRACIETLTGLRNVPHFFNGADGVECWSFLRKHLRSEGFDIVLFTIPDPFDFMEFNNPTIPYMLMCKNTVGDHAIVIKNGVVFNDPAMIEREIIGPHSCGQWIAGVIVKT